MHSIPRNTAFFTALLLLGMTLHPLLVIAEIPWKVGQHYEHWIEIFGRQVPLPEGDWVLAGVGTDSVNLQPPRPYGVIATVVLFKLDGTTVTAFALIHANAIPSVGGWGLSRDCQRTDLPFAKIYENSEQHAFCAFIRPMTTPLTATTGNLAAWRDALALASQQGWQVTPTWREAGFRISDWYDILDVRYAFKDSPGNEFNATDTDLTHWVEALRPLIYSGFKRSFTEQHAVIDMPSHSKPAPHSENMSHSARSPKEMSNTELGLWKVASSRVINISTSLGIDYLFVGNMYLAAGLQFVSSTFHGGVDYLEELMWNTYGPQRLRQANVCDFTYID
jgi:hypothetical protein